MSNSSKKSVQFGIPTEDVPESKGPGHDPSPWWLEVADQCRHYPNMWLPVTIDGLSESRHRQVPGDIKHGRLVAFKEGTWDSVHRGGQLYVKAVVA